MFRPRGYYAMLDVPVDALDDRAGALRRAEALLAAGPCCLQLRAKGADAARMLALAEALVPAARRAGVPLCVNDRLDVALAAGADMVHLGQDDLPLAEARAVAAGRILIGVSTHTLAQAIEAERDGANVIAFGPVFPTASKERPDPVVGLGGLAAVCARVKLPVVAIGGIDATRAADVARAGAAAAAVIGAVNDAPDPTAAGRAIARAWTIA